jgi:hypothetical protein
MIPPPHPLQGRNLRRRAAAVDSAWRSSPDGVEPALDQRDVFGHAIAPAGDIGALRFDQTKTSFDIDQIGLHLSDVAANGAAMFEDSIGASVAHELDFGSSLAVAKVGRREEESNP